MHCVETCVLTFAHRKSKDRFTRISVFSFDVRRTRRNARRIHCDLRLAKLYRTGNQRQHSRMRSDRVRADPGWCAVAPPPPLDTILLRMSLQGRGTMEWHLGQDVPCPVFCAWDIAPAVSSSTASCVSPQVQRWVLKHFAPRWDLDPWT